MGANRRNGSTTKDRSRDSVAFLYFTRVIGLVMNVLLCGGGIFYYIRVSFTNEN